jgi:hypothetical protein
MTELTPFAERREARRQLRSSPEKRNLRSFVKNSQHVDARTCESPLPRARAKTLYSSTRSRRCCALIMISGSSSHWRDESCMRRRTSRGRSLGRPLMSSDATRGKSRRKYALYAMDTIFRISPSMRKRLRALASTGTPQATASSYSRTASSASTWPSAGTIPTQAPRVCGIPLRMPLPYPIFTSTRTGRTAGNSADSSRRISPVRSRDPLSTVMSSSRWPARSNAATKRRTVWATTASSL